MSHERTPLLHEDASKRGETGDDVELRSTAGELAHLAARALPVAASYALQNALQTASVLVVGRLGPDELSAAAQAYLVAMTTAWCVGLGGTTALDTLASSLYTTPGADRRLLGVLLQRCCLVLFALYLPIAALWVFGTRPIFLALGQTDRLATDVQTFLRVLAPFAPGYIFFESGTSDIASATLTRAVKKFWQAQGSMHAATVVLIITAPICLLLNWLFIHKLQFGMIGAPLATGITYVLSFLLLVAAIPFTRAKECWGGWDRRAFHHTWAFTKLAVPGIFSVASEWIAFEIVAQAAGRLGDIPLAAQSVIQTLDQVMVTLPFGQGVAASARIGNLLGARASKMAARSTHTAVGLAVLVGTGVLVVLFALREQVGFAFTDEASVARAVADVLPYVAAFQIADGITQSTAGVLRGIGKQHISALVNLIAYYAIAVPIGLALAFRAGLGLKGLWMGQCLALYLVGIGQWSYLLFRVDWADESDSAAKRNEDDEHPSAV